jgi:hypothetical protein
LKYSLTILALLAVPAFAQTDGSVHVTLSPIPPYPADGVFRPGIQDQYVFWNPPAGYVISFDAALDPAARPGPNGRVEIPVVFPSQTSPVVEVQIQRAGAEYIYSYTVTNRADARTAVQSVLLRTRSLQAVDGLSLLPSSPGWLFESSSNPNKYSGLVWTGSTPLPPEGTPIHFSFRSSAKPGITEIEFRGLPMDRAVVDGLPDPVRQQVLKWESGFLNSTRLLTVGPYYAPSTNPFAIAADLFSRTQVLPEHSKNTPFATEVRSRLKQYLDSVAPTFEFVEDNLIRPDLRVDARPASYEDGLLHKVIAATLDVN